MNFNVLKTKALSKNQMRAIKGGSGTCGKAQAMHMATEEGHWCCDSCGSSSYCG